MTSAVLLLGGGFIAQALSRQLIAAGREVLVLARRPASADFSGAICTPGAVQDRGLLQQLLPRCKTVAYLASSTTPGVSARQPTLEIDNLAPLLTLLDVLQAFPATHLIYFSSGGTLYGNPDVLPVGETAPMRPLSFHGAGKAASELFLNVARQQGRAVTILRPANAYGPGQALKSGFGLVRTVLEHLRCESPVEIWGDGEAVRDFVFVDDVAAACCRLIDRPADRETYNIGSAVGHSLNELIQLAGAVSGRLPRVIHRPGRPGDVAKVVLAIDKLRGMGWSPTVSLEEGLRRTWQGLIKQTNQCGP